MKSDFCFTFYDGDAARDIQHMDRVAKGGYMDILLSQRNFGHLSLEYIKRIFGADFDQIWPLIEMVMIKDDEGRFYVEWLEISEIRAKAHSQKQSDNGKKGGRPKKDITQMKPNKNPNKGQTISQKKPLGDGNGDEYEYGNKDKDEDDMKETDEETDLGTFQVNMELSLPLGTLEAIERNQVMQTKSPNTEFIQLYWTVFLSERIAEPLEQRNQYRQLTDLTRYFTNWMRNKFPQNTIGSYTKRRATNAGIW